MTERMTGGRGGEGERRRKGEGPRTAIPYVYVHLCLSSSGLACAVELSRARATVEVRYSGGGGRRGKRLEKGNAADFVFPFFIFESVPTPHFARLGGESPSGGKEIGNGRVAQRALFWLTFAMPEALAQFSRSTRTSMDSDGEGAKGRERRGGTLHRSL